ncbi:MAG: DUF2905 domain-containing protein [Deltaproteobacteria bacterium]|nr:MAG: DUF2905 domain-containing protein [Deltaproteobacteria bacterium]
MEDMRDMGLLLIALGVFILVAGIIILLGGHLCPFGRLPGDIRVVRNGLTIYFPITTCILISIVLTFILSMFR